MKMYGLWMRVFLDVIKYVCNPTNSNNHSIQNFYKLYKKVRIKAMWWKNMFVEILI